jgi:hypothetical protein
VLPGGVVLTEPLENRGGVRHILQNIAGDPSISGPQTLGFVVKIASERSEPYWLIADPEGTPGDFGTRDKAVVFPTREIAELHAQRWAAVLEPAISVAVEPAD